MDGLELLTDLNELLALEPAGSDRFRARTPHDERVHLFGGLTFGLAARAAALTVDGDRSLYAASCQYVSGGVGGMTLDLDVERVRDGRSLSLRRVRLSAGDRLLFTCDAWFAPEEEGPDWQPPRPVDDQHLAVLPIAPLAVVGLDPIEILTVRSAAEAEELIVHPYWARSRHPLGEDRTLHLGALAFMSDLATIGLVRQPDGPGRQYTVTLNHSLWVHRPFTLDQWLRVDGEAQSIHGNRGLATGSVHTADGALVATFAQEAMRRA